MQKNGTAPAGDRRVVIIAQIDNQVVQVVAAPQGLVRGSERQRDRSVVLRMMRGVAPTVMQGQGAGGQPGFWLLQAVRTVA